MKSRTLGILTLALFTAACSSSDEPTGPSDDDGVVDPDPDPDPDPEPVGLPILGDGTHDVANVIITPVASGDDGLNVPTDLAFHPFVAGELWITSQADDSIVIVNDVGLPSRSAEKYGGPTTQGASHFLANPSGIAFSLDNGNAATSHEEDQITQSTTPADFMGPTLWSTDRLIFDGGHSGHLDMLHNSPNGMGIAWDSGNAFWIYDGYHSSVTRYDFADDHGPGGADHSDGIIERCVEGSMTRQPQAPSGMEMNHETGWLYIADTGAGRIARLDTNSGTEGAPIFPNYDATVQRYIDGAVIETFIDTAAQGASFPSGLALRGGMIFVGDVGNGTLYAYSMETGEMIDFLPLGLANGALKGIAFDEAGNLYAIDSFANQVIQIQPAPEATE